MLDVEKVGRNVGLEGAFSGIKSRAFYRIVYRLTAWRTQEKA
jgi:hypothetical protein